MWKGTLSKFEENGERADSVHARTVTGMTKLASGWQGAVSTPSRYLRTFPDTLGAKYLVSDLA
jgi:hypothetical protein